MKLVNKLRQRGVTLFEVLLVLFVGAFIAVGVTVIYTRAVNSVASNQLNSNVQQMAASVHSLYQATGDYSGLTTAIVQSIAPSDMVKNGQSVTPSFVVGVGNQVGSWTATAGNTSWTLTITNIPTNACASLTGYALGAGAQSVNGSTDPGAAAAACGTNGTAAMVFN
jgi:Tfp pilus assembly protein PilE